MSAPQVQNFIGNQWVPPIAGKYLENLNPATAEILSWLPDSQKEDVDQAVAAAKKAFPAWSKTSRADRAQWLRKIADLVEKRIDEFALLESQDQGKPVTLAKNMDIQRVVQNFRFFADEILKTREENFDDPGVHNFVIRKPVGVAGLISPWNLPLYLLSWKIAPAIAAGNTVVCKPSEFTSMTAALLGEVIKDVGLPSGVVNIVFGLGPSVGEAIVKHPSVPLISFTGGTETGKRIYRDSAENFKKISLELGGKNPNIIFADCNLDQAVEISVRSSFLNQGEICLCGSRVYVEEKIAPQFLERLVEATKKMKVGNPEAEGTQMGALVSKAHLEKVQSYIALAKKEGAKILCGGDQPHLEKPFQNGYFLNPTIITGVDQKSKCVQEEIFGPVITVQTFKTEDEVINLANDVRYGLSASVWTEDVQKAERVAGQLDVGTVWVNTWLLRDLRMPFGGMKHSGLGREGGQYSMEFFSELTTVCRKKGNV